MRMRTRESTLCRPQSRSQSFVPLDQRSENVSSGSNHYERTKEITEFWLSGSLRICIYGACLKWLLPELSFSDRWSRGTKLWERDCAVLVSSRTSFRLSCRRIENVSILPCYAWTNVPIDLIFSYLYKFVSKVHIFHDCRV